MLFGYSGYDINIMKLAIDTWRLGDMMEMCEC